MVTKDQQKATNPDEVLDWEISKIESGLKALAIVIGKIGRRATKHMN